MPKDCTVCCLTFTDTNDLARHYASKKHIQMVKKAENRSQDEEVEEMADPRLLPKEVIDVLIDNHPSYIRVSKELTEKRQKMIDRFTFLHELFLNYKQIDYSQYNEQEKEYYEQNYNHPDLLVQRYPTLKYSSKEIQEMIEEKDMLVEELIKIHRQYDIEKPKWRKLTMNELIAEYNLQEKEIQKRQFKEMKMKQLMEMMNFKK